MRINFQLKSHYEFNDDISTHLHRISGGDVYYVRKAHRRQRLTVQSAKSLYVHKVHRRQGLSVLKVYNHSERDWARASAGVRALKCLLEYDLPTHPCPSKGGEAVPQLIQNKDGSFVTAIDRKPASGVGEPCEHCRRLSG